MRVILTCKAVLFILECLQFDTEKISFNTVVLVFFFWRYSHSSFECVKIMKMNIETLKLSV